MVSILNQYARVSTWHGITDWNRVRNGPSRILLAFWSLVLLGAIAAVIYYNYMLVVQFMTKATASKITYTEVDRIQFPNITVCHQGKLNYSFISDALDQMNKSDPPTTMYILNKFHIQFLDVAKSLLYNYLLAMIVSRPWIDFTVNQTVVQAESVYQLMFNKTLYPNRNEAIVPEIIQFLNGSGYQCNGFLVQCFYRSSPFNCCENSLPFFGREGGCYQLQFQNIFNVNGNPTTAYQTQPGVHNGIKIITKFNRTETYLSSKTKVPTGMFLRMDDMSPFEFNYASVPPNMHALTRLNAKKYVVDPSLSNCIANPGPVLGFNYTRGMCFASCLVNMSIAKCNCTGYSSTYTDETRPYCQPLKNIECTLPLVTGRTHEDQDRLEEFQKCAVNNCSRPCEYWIYEQSVTYNRMSKAWVSKTFNQSNVVDIEYAGATLFYGKLEYELVEEILLMDGNSLFANIGNVMGLWMGVSIISFVQCISCLFLGVLHKKDKD